MLILTKKRMKEKKVTKEDGGKRVGLLRRKAKETTKMMIITMEAVSLSH